MNERVSDPVPVNVMLDELAGTPLLPLVTVVVSLVTTVKLVFAKAGAMPVIVEAPVESVALPDTQW